MARNPLAWLDAPLPHTGVHVAGRDGWSFVPYPELAGQARAVAAQLVDRGLEPAAVVSLSLTGTPFIASFFGALLAGLVPSPLAPADTMEPTDGYQRRLDHAFRAVEPSLVLAASEHLPLLEEVARRREIPAAAPSHDGGVAPRRPAPELAVLQYTSGSSGRPRAVEITMDNLARTIETIAAWQHTGDGDAVASWLPAYHDMGLVGCILTAVVEQMDLWLMRPAQFVRDPLRWLRCLGTGRATMTASPNFGFDYVLRRVPEDRLAGLDFSTWRTAIIGAERIFPHTLRRFAELLAPHGFRYDTFCPAYGLAEATLFVTGIDVGKTPRIARVDPATTGVGSQVTVLAEGPLDRMPLDDDGDLWLCECGTAPSHTRVRVLDEAGNEVPDGVVGELAVTGPTVARGYRGPGAENPGGGGTRFTGSEVDTADAGFLWRGSLYVLGRIGDSVKVRGRMVYVEDMESSVAMVPGAFTPRSMVLAGMDRGDPAVVYLTDVADQEVARAAARVLHRHVGGSASVKVLYLRKGLRTGVARTTSGKPRRREAWQRYVSGGLAGEPLVELPADR
jgi:fatty-acyl-CoA synthase